MNRKDFFLKIRPNGPWILSAIVPDSVILTETFTDIDKLEEWIESWNGKANIYFLLNESDVSNPTSKPGKDRMVSLTHLHVDIDPEEGKPLEESRKEIKARVDAFKPEPSIVIDSGGGYQVIWTMEDPVTIIRSDGKDNIEELEAYNRQLTNTLQGDKSAHNVDRIMRVPGTINIPTKSKKAKGRLDNTDAKLVEFNNTTYRLSQFVQAQVVANIAVSDQAIDLSNLLEVDVDDLNLNTILVDVIKNGKTAKKNFSGDRSKSVWYAVCNMVKAELDDKTIASVLLNSAYDVSDHVLNGSHGRSPEEYVKRQIIRARDHAVAPEMTELNDKYCVVKEGNKVKVFEEYYDTELKRQVIRKMSFTDFQDFYCNREVVQYINPQTGTPKMIVLGKWWLTHANRKTYNNVIFAPNKITPGVFNLWRGFACEAIPGTWDLFRGHIFNNICSGNKAHYEYLMSWMARCVQQPATQGEAAVVLRGKKGVGKGVFGEHFGYLFGQHYLHISQKSHLVGNFNQHLRDCVFLQADEAFYAGDKSHESVMKALITESLMMVEPKGVNSIQCRNYIHLLMCSNEKWVVPAGDMERRFFVLEVSPECIQDTMYFHTMKQQMLNGGYEAMLHELQLRDISKFQVRNPPKTAALTEQQIRSMDIEHEWWYEKLKEGCIVPSHVCWDDPVNKTALLDDYTKYARDSGVRRLSKNLTPFFESVLPGRRGPVSTIRVIDDYHDPVLSDGKKRVVTQAFPKLRDCRDSFDQIAGITTDWDELDVVKPVEDNIGELPF